MRRPRTEAEVRADMVADMRERGALSVIVMLGACCILVIVPAGMALWKILNG